MAEGDRPATSFVGRAVELATLRARVASARVVTLVGPGGSGKTRLALEARPVLAEVAGPVLGVVELAAATPQDDLWSVVLEACGIRDDPSLTPLARFARRLDGAAGVLVLDNCEHLRDGVAEAVAGLVRACPGLRVLATGRAALGVPEEVTVPVDGLPLALELVAAHARALPLAALGPALPDTRAPARDPRHRSLRACLDWSTALVGAPARAGLAALAVVDGAARWPRPAP